LHQPAGPAAPYNPAGAQPGGWGCPGTPAEAMPPPSLSYVVESYLPFILATVAYPLAGALYHVARALASGSPPRRPGGWAYTAYLAVGAFLLLGGSLAFFKAAVDYTYGAPVRWRSIAGEAQLRLYLEIAGLHAKLNLLAGLALGALALLPLSRRSYDYYLVDLIVYAGNLGWYLALSPTPLRDFYFTYAARSTLHIPPGLRPYDLVAGQLREALAAGFAAGLALALAAWARTRRPGPRAGGRRRLPELPLPTPSQGAAPYSEGPAPNLLEDHTIL